MAAQPPIGTGTQFSDMFSMPDFKSASGAGSDKARQFGAMISEIERVRSRFENEKSNSAQFGQQMTMLAQQIESLTSQQSTMLGYHIGRMDMMLKELKNSKDTLSKEEQRAQIEAEARAKFEREREMREREERERLNRERLERERRELMEKLEQQNRERVERERREENERREREHREKMKTLQNASLPNMNLSDIIPQPSRTVTASKRKLSLDVSSSSSNAAKSSSSSSAASATPDSNKRAKTAAGDDIHSVFKRFMKDQNTDGDAQPPKPVPAAGDAMSDVEDANNAMADDMPTPEAAMGENDLPLEVQEQLKMQAMEMLQAQLAAGDGGESSGPLPLSSGAAFASKPAQEPAGPMASLSSSAPSAASSSSSSSAVKPEPGTKQQPPAAVPPSSSAAAAATPVKVEKPKAAAKSTGKSTGKRAKKPKVVTPAVEDTTIADPMSVPLKNKAIHQWMMKDPDRLYTADDICKAGIRYRAGAAIPQKKIAKGKVYLVTETYEVRKTFGQKRLNNVLWRFVGRSNNNCSLWKAIVQNE